MCEELSLNVKLQERNDYCAQSVVLCCSSQFLVLQKQKKRSSSCFMLEICDGNKQMLYVEQCWVHFVQIVDDGGKRVI